MKFITILALAACAVLVSAAPHGGSNGNTNINDESNQEVNINHESKTKVTDNSATDIKSANLNQESDNNYAIGTLAGLLQGNILKEGILKGGINVLGSSTQTTNNNQEAHNH